MSRWAVRARRPVPRALSAARLPDAYLYVVWPVEPGVFSHLRETEASLAAYREAKASRARIQFGFVAHLPRDGAAGAARRGLVRHGGRQQHRRAGRAAGAGGRPGRRRRPVGAGRHSADDPEEIAGLSRAFNRMTRDLEAQQQALVRRPRRRPSRAASSSKPCCSASAPASIGLDRAGQDLGGQPPGRDACWSCREARAGPPLRRPGAGVPARWSSAPPAAGGEVEEDVDVVRGGESRRLRAARRPQPRRPGADLRRHHPPGRRPAQRRLEGRRAPHRPRDQEPADADPAVGRAPAAQIPRRDRPATSRPSTAAPTPSSARSATSAAWSTSSPPSPACRRRSSPPHDAAELLRQAVFAQRVADPETQIEIERAGRRRQPDVRRAG